MRHTASLQFRLGQIAMAVAGVFGIACSAQTANTDIANEPLAQAASGVRPNLMFILDDSGSMGNDFSPDYIVDDQPSGATPSQTAGCFDSGDTGTSSNNFDNAAGSIAGRPDACVAGDPPYMSPDFNKQYYNPAIYYRPAANADGTDRIIMNAGNTTNWIAVPTDAFNIQNKDQLGNTVTTANLVNGYPDRAWCQLTSDDPLGANCRTNSGYSFPDADFPYGLSGVGGNVKYRFGNPYYYRMQTAQWCSSAALTASTCVSGSSVNPATHIFPAGEFCTDAELTNCAVGTALTAAHTFTGARFCSDAGTLLNCQRKKIGNFMFPKHLGATTTSTSPTPERAAIGSITVTLSVAPRQITNITIGGISVISGAITATGTNTSTLATQIRTAINSLVSLPDYTASGTGSTVTITAATTGTGENGKAIVVTAPAVGTVRASATLTINATANNNSVNITQVTVTGAGNIMSPTCAGGFLNGVSAAGGIIIASLGTNAANERTSTAQAVATCINAATGTNGGYSASFSGAVVTVRAPLVDGASANLKVLTKAGSVPTTGSNFAGGQSTVIQTNVSNMQGGTAAGSAGQTVRIGVGLFSRTDIVPATATYTKSLQRIDCSGTDCSYNEEMANFANWYAYYRTRIQMMKSAAGRAFIPIDDTYRVGFITINPGNPVSSNKYLKIDTFDAVHKSAWYTKFYDRTVGSGTPLREALSRVGRHYAGQIDGINDGMPEDPLQLSCQPNFAILSTDGYWNGGGGKLIDGADMTQQDNTNTAPYSKREDGVFDGGASATIGLADVALYYYQTDLRPCPGGTPLDGICINDPKASDNVPTTQKDVAPHQHMTTFTLGLGLDGELTYIKTYETAATGAFAQIKAGTISWPDPNQNAPSALDDLWHAAVNGRGVFFSASDPQELANGLSETLDELQKRVGAGAAAATSNLQPVAGDNFAFTAQYQTSDWIGDLKARTIDLGSGAVSSVVLWSAQAKLDARTVSSRILFTLDAGDTAGNRLKHFCWPGTPGASCSDGAGLTGAEQLLFNPNLLPQYIPWNGAQKAQATAEGLVNFLRGDATYESTGGVLATDLFRDRTSRLGDIINAQPAYVKASPFNYTDNGYLDFKKCTQGTTVTSCPTAQFPAPTLPRRSTVYAAANDGMLHAFETDVNNNPYFQKEGIGTSQTSDDVFTGNNAGNGEERWAYIPAMILPNLYKLASIPYSHRYFTDGTPLAGDICISNPCAGIADWRTILVAGLNSGGRGYYALDVTNPLAPKALWEFKVRKPSANACAATEAAAVGASDDCDLGLTYGNPAITKLSTGQWVVIVASGYNNTGIEPPPGTARQGDGKGYLYILDAVTGTIIKKIGTGVGDGGTAGANFTDADPSGLARINNWVENSLQDNTSLAVYGGDLKGNLWRFDLDATKPTYLTAVKVAEVKDGTNPQPITVKPELGLVKGNRVIFFGTGKFLGTSDKTDSQRQTLYAIRDDLATNITVTDRTSLIQQTLTPLTGGLTRAGSSNTVNWTSPSVRGWFIDLPDGGSGTPASPTERVSVDPQLQLGTLVISTNVPSSDSCTAGGFSWINFLNFETGGFIQGADNNVVSTKISSSLVVGLNIVQLPGGVVKVIVTTADNQQLTQDTPVAPTTFQGRRVGWRELVAD